jgi:hypothetical protein
VHGRLRLGRPIPYDETMHAVMFADFLGLGHSLSPFGYTLALILTWFVLLPVLAMFLISYAVILILAERRENQTRMAAYDERHRPQS